MYYLPDRKRGPLFEILKFLLLGLSIILLSGLIGFSVGYAEFKLPAWAMRPTPLPTATRPASYDLAVAEANFIEGKLDESVEALEQVIQKEPTNDLPYTRQAKLLVYTGDTGKAVERGAQAVAINPNNPENLANYCRALDWEAEYEDALEVCFCATELYPKYVDSYAFVAEVYADLGNVFAAKKYAQQALDLDYNNANAHQQMGYAFEVQGRYKEAAEEYDKAITLAPNIAPFYISAGMVYHTMGQYRQYQKMAPYQLALDRFKRAIKLRPFQAEGYARLGWTFYFDGQYQRATEALEQALGLDPTYDKAWGYLASVNYTRQRYEQASKLYPTAIQFAENKLLRRARQLEIYAVAPTLSGDSYLPILRGRFEHPKDAHEMRYTVQLKIVPYVRSTDLKLEQNCAELLAQSIKAETVIMESQQPITFTQAFSDTTGTATLDLNSGDLAMDLKNLPVLSSAYQIKMHFFPRRVDNLGFFQPNIYRQAKLNIKIGEKLPAPVEYYYQLGLAFAYLDPPVCDKAEPWLLKALEIEPASWNPAWHGLRICPSPKSPPTPIPTSTPFPTATPTK